MSAPSRDTVGTWLASRTPPPPELLRVRILRALGRGIHDEVMDTERVCLDAAERVLAGLFGDGAGQRAEAADLLAADALVTYALEFAAEEPAEFRERATRAMARFGQLRKESA